MNAELQPVVAEPFVDSGESMRPEKWQAIPRLSEALPEPILYRAEDVRGIDLLLHGISEREGPTGRYLVLDCEAPEPIGGQTLIQVSCGGRVVVEKLDRWRRLADRGEVPCPVVIRLVQVAGSGARTYWDVR